MARHTPIPIHVCQAIILVIYIYILKKIILSFFLKWLLVSALVQLETPAHQLHWSYLLYDISRLKYMFTMYRYVTGVLDKVPNTFSFFYKTKQSKKSNKIKQWDLWKTITPGGRVPQFHCFVTSSPLIRRLNCSVLVVGRFGTIQVNLSW